MSNNHERDMAASEAAQFQVQTGAEGAAGNSGRSRSGIDRQPTDAELNSCRDMTGEEWTATVAEGKQRIAGIEMETSAAVAAITEEQAEKWEHKIRALTSIQPSGNPAEDARSFLEAIGLDPSKLGSYAQAYREGNKSMMLRYFKEVDKQGGHELPAFLSEAARRYFQAFEQLVKKIINAAEKAGVKE